MFQRTSDSRHYPFELPSGWVWTTLGEISNYGLCSNVPVTEIDNNSWVLELEDLEKDSAKILKTILRGNREINGVRHKFRKGEILYSKLRTYLNKVLVAPNDGFCTTEIIPFNTFADISNQYICHVLRSEYFLSYTHQCGYGVKMPRLSTGDACKALIPLPPINEQIKIVQAIDCYFNLIEYIENDSKCLSIALKQAKNKILDLAIHGKLVPQDPTDEPASELLKRVKPSAEITCDNEQYWNMPRGWVICNFNQIFKTVSSKQFQIQQSEILTTGKTPVVSQSSLFIEGYSNETNICKYHPCIIFGDHTRNVKYIDFEFIVGADGVKILMPEFNPKYAYYLIKYATLNIENKGYSRHFGQISKFKFPLPPLAEQQRIVAKIEELFAQLDAIENSLQA